MIIHISMKNKKTMSKLIFLSYIYEETELAHIIQKALEDEFGDLIEFFVSSDGKILKPGFTFLQRVEDPLVNCVGAIYLISPASMKRNWINFEMGAVWIRNAMSLKKSRKVIPTIPVCHSGMLIDVLPVPLSNLDAVSGKNASQLEMTFKKIQTAIGKKGKLTTDFAVLSKQIIDFENRYTSVIEKVSSKPNKKHKVTQEKRKRNIDVGNLKWALNTLYIPTFERFLNEMPDKIIGKIFFFKDSFVSVLESGTFQIYDQELLKRLKKFKKNWVKLLSFPQYYEPAGSDEHYEFRLKADALHNKQGREALNKLIKIKSELDDDFKDLLRFIIENYLEIDLEEASKNAFKSYRASIVNK